MGKRFVAAMLAVFLLVLPLAGCASGGKTLLRIEDPSFSVSYDLVRYVLLSLIEKENRASEDWTDGEIENLKSEAIEVIRQYYGVLSLSTRYGIDPEDETFRKVAEQQIDAQIQEYGSRAAFLDALKQNFMTLDVFRFFEICRQVQDELYYAMLRSGTIQTDEAVLDSVIHSDELVRVKQILIDPDEYSSREEAYAAALSVLEKAKGGEDFDRLVNTYGKDLYMFNNPDGYYLFRGVWYRTFEETAFSLAIGEISDIIETPAGYSILLRLEKDEAYLTKNFKSLCDDYYDSAFSLAIEKESARLTVQRTEDFDRLDPLSLKM